MKLLNRMGLQVRADAHGVMDRLEDRALLMKQHLREAEIELDRKRAHIDALEEQLRHIDDQVVRERREADRLDQDVELALRGGKEELARFALKRLLPRNRALEGLKAHRDEVAEERRRRSETLQTQDQAFHDLRDRVRARLVAMEEEWASPLTPADAIADEEIDLELLRRQRARSTESGSNTGEDA